MIAEVLLAAQIAAADTPGVHLKRVIGDWTIDIVSDVIERQVKRIELFAGSDDAAGITFDCLPPKARGQPWGGLSTLWATSVPTSAHERRDPVAVRFRVDANPPVNAVAEYVMLGHVMFVGPGGPLEILGQMNQGHTLAVQVGRDQGVIGIEGFSLAAQTFLAGCDALTR